MLFSFTIPVHKSKIHWIPIFPVACIISATNPDNPGSICVVAVLQHIAAIIVGTYYLTEEYFASECCRLPSVL